MSDDSIAVNDVIIDVEAEEIIDHVVEEVAEEVAEETTRPFFVVTHKTPLVRTFEPFGALQAYGTSVDPGMAPLTLWWCSQDWAAQVTAAGVDMPQLLAPTPGFIARLDRKWLNREVGHIRKGDVAALYTKHPELVAENPQVVISTGCEHSELVPPMLCSSAELANGIFPAPYSFLPDHVGIQLEQQLSCVIEARYWVANGELTAACPYRMGILGWDSPLFVEMLFNDNANQLLTLADQHARNFASQVNGPPGYALDLGITDDGTVTVLRVSPSWSADPLSADPAGVFQSLVASHDFDQILDYDIWHWDPNLAIYDRTRLTGGEPTIPTETEEESTDA